MKLQRKQETVRKTDVLDSVRRILRTAARGLCRRLPATGFIALASGLTCASTPFEPAEPTPVADYRNIVRNYGPGDGFSQNEVTALVQGRDGYLWLGTFGGLVRFDGDKFTTLRAVHGSTIRDDPMDSDGPSSDRIVELRQDLGGRMWIGTQDGGLNVYEHGRFRHLPICGGVCEVHALSPQNAQTVWVATGVGVFRVATDTFRAVPIRDTTAGFYTEVAVGNDGHAYLSSKEKPMGKVVGEDIVPVPLPDGVTSTRQMIGLGGQIWIATDNGLYRFDPAQAAWEPKLAEPEAQPLESPDGRLWVSTRSGSLLQAGPSGELQAVAELPPMSINAVWPDRDGVLWIGTVQEGLWSMQASTAMLRGNTSDRLVYGAGGRAIVGDGMGGVWLGFACGGIRHRLRDGSHEELSTDLIPRDECIASLLHDADGSLWASTGHGLMRFAGEVVETISHPSDLRNLQIWQSERGEYWLAADGNTFNIRRTDAGTFALSEPVVALAGQIVRRMVTAREGGVWFAGDHGVVRVEEGRIVERWTPEQGLSSRFARSVYEDNDGVLWIGTYGGGLNRIESGVLTHYDESNGLSDDTVSCILVDRAGHMWLGGNRGISVLPKASQQGGSIETIPFAISSGSVSFELNGGTQSACYQDEKGHLWFALVKGFAEIDPTRLVGISARQPEVHIERVTSAGLKHDPLGTVVLDASAQLLEIGYTAINLTSPDQLSFRYRVSSIDPKWIDAGSTKNIIFQDVPWGDSLFEVQARNRGGRWSPSATLVISRPMPWYQRQWLWPLAALLALLTVLWRTREYGPPGRHDERLSRITGRKLRD